jgi:proteasome lid subunit RPN8/RPN11
VKKTMTSASTSSEPGQPAGTPPDAPPHGDPARGQWPEQILLHGIEAAWPVTVAFSQEALIAIQRHCESDMRVELGGVLVGRVGRHDGRNIVHVHNALPAHSDQHGPVHFTFTADAWRQLNQDRAAAFPDLQIVGWFHTHPDLGVFFSGDDVVVHQAAFTQPWHVGLVVDPIRHEMALFGWEGQTEHQRLVNIRGFVELPDLQPEPATPWQVPRTTAVWADYSEAEAAAVTDRLEEEERYASLSPTGAPEILPAPSAALPLSFLGVLLALLALVVALPQRNRVDDLEAALLALSDAALADATAGGAASCPSASLRIVTPLAGETVDAGESVRVVGTADYPQSSGYELAIRPAAGGQWVTIAEIGDDVTLGLLTEWTAPLQAEPYEMQLQALDAGGTPLATCRIAVPIK